jgi:hypothetical protein
MKFLLGILLILSMMGGVMDPAQATGESEAAMMGNRATQQVIVSGSPAQVLPAAAKAFESWKRGQLVSVAEPDLQVKGLSRTNFFKFIDDITVSLQPLPGDASQTQVEITSVGRMGEYDFGGNQRNIDEYLATLRSLLPKG